MPDDAGARCLRCPELRAERARAREAFQAIRALAVIHAGKGSAGKALQRVAKIANRRLKDGGQNSENVRDLAADRSLPMLCPECQEVACDPDCPNPRASA